VVVSLIADLVLLTTVYAPRRASPPRHSRAVAAGAALGVERLGSDRRAVAQRDLLDPCFGLLQEPLAMRLQRLAAFIDGDRLRQRRLAAFQHADDLLELGERVLETHGFDVVILGFGQ